MAINKKNITLNFIGLIFLFFSIAAIINSIYIDKPQSVLWFCYFGLFIISIGVFTKNDSLIISQLNILAIPLIVWVLDFFSYFIFGRTILGITDYMFTNGDIIGKIISFQHLITIPLSIYALIKIRIKSSYALKINLIQVPIFFVLSRYLTDEIYNVNCVYRPCMNIPYFYLYQVAWFVGYILMIAITNYLFITLMKKEINYY